ncbi:MAG: helix-turn-helix domain-containing protein [Burkholderiales bacterium]|nr:helix-turn-helix domain-containing protein [Burkholderiales bacterium]
MKALSAVTVAADRAPDAIAQCQTVCSDCNLRELCVPCCGLTRHEKDVAERLAFHRSRVRRGASLYRTGDRFASLFGVRSGFFKKLALLEDGRHQVTGFKMAGELLGMDAIGTERHTGNAVALENSEVCVIPFAGLQALAQEIPSLQRHFRRTMSREIVREQGMMLQLGTMSAEERLALLLLDLSRRFAMYGYSSTEFNLRMTRDEMGSYLGLKLETVSRILSRLQGEGLIRVKQKFIRILDRPRLEQVLGRRQD